MEAPVWGWQTVFYLWVAGLAGGTYMCAMLVNLWAGRWHREIVRVSTLLTIPLLVLGAVALTTDLGQPARFWHLFAAWRPSSPMWFGTYILTLGSIVGAGLVLHEILATLKVRLPGAAVLEFLVTWLGLILAGVLVVYV
ncbi:MAG: polysulfide reductase NrfD, partial [Chloroflexi bacterium]|nr:polysulfide reductase NrfD [Chloroflexota bacterium]